MIGGDKGLPTSVAGLFAAGLTAYARRFVLYAALALAAFALQLAADYATKDPGLAVALNLIVDSFAIAAVSIGVAADVAGKETNANAIVKAASLRWGVVAIVSGVNYLLFRLFWPSMFLPPDQTGYGLLLVPFVVMVGALTVAQVVAAIEPVKSRLTLPLVALGKGVLVSLKVVNLGRLMLLSVLLTTPLFAETVAGAYLFTHGFADADFWASIPLDALTFGPLQAIATVFYLDFLRRGKR